MIDLVAYIVVWALLMSAGISCRRRGYVNVAIWYFNIAMALSIGYFLFWVAWVYVV